MKIFDCEKTAAVENGAKEVTFTIELQQMGVTQLETWFIDAGRQAQGAYYVYVERL